MVSATQPETGVTLPHLEMDLLAGVVLEVRDLAATRAFYEPIFREVSGQWATQGSSLVYRYGPQTIEFIRRARPRTFADGGQHQAYRVPSRRLRSLADELTAAGHAVNWWREDHPAEKGISAYLQDPSGNWVQLVASEDHGLLLDHAAIEVHNFDYCEAVYVESFGGLVDYYHGWRLEDEAEAKVWGAGDDPCAPWTRRDNPGWFDFARSGGHNPNLRVPRANTQIFIRMGDTRLGLISATKVRQELPPGVIRATPRLTFRTRLPASEAAMVFSRTLPLRFEQRGTSLFVRDPDGNFCEVQCAE
jgi:hypothetical protein